MVIAIKGPDRVRVDDDWKGSQWTRVGYGLEARRLRIGLLLRCDPSDDGNRLSIDAYNYGNNGV